MFVEADPRQLLACLVIGVGSHAVCARCHRSNLTAGEEIGVYAYRWADEPYWVAARCYCADCAPATIGHPTRDTAELLVTGRLTHVADDLLAQPVLRLRRVTVRDTSDPDAGQPRED